MKPDNMTPMNPEQLRKRMTAALRRALEQRYASWRPGGNYLKVWDWHMQWVKLLEEEAKKHGISY